MLFRVRTLALCCLLGSAACATDAGPPGPPPAGPAGPARPGGGVAAPASSAAVSLGMTVMASDASGTPRLVRALAPRAAPVAGLPPEVTARDHLAALAPLWVQGAAPVALADAGTQRLRNGATVVKLAQQIDGVPVDGGELRVLLHADGALAAVSGTLQPATATRGFARSPREAVERALDQQYTTARAHPTLGEAVERGGWYQVPVAADPQLQVETARTRRVLTPAGGGLAPAWETEIVGRAPAPRGTLAPRGTVARRARREAGETMAERHVISEDGTVVRTTDLIQRDAFLYRAYAETTGNRRPLDGAFESFAPHPTGVPDGSAPALAATQLVVMDAFNGPRDPWLPGDATTTAGNNAEAFADLDGSYSFTEGDLRPDVRAGRVLNHAFDPRQQPLASPEQSKAAAVNAFFVVNWMHDWWYDSGFTEAVGDAQQDNYGRGGVDGDPLTIFAQWGANIGKGGNASMFTGRDGTSPHMQLMLWPDNTELVTTPTGTVKGATLAREPAEFDLTETLVAGLDGPPPDDGCPPLTGDVSGRIALLYFSESSECGPVEAVASARAAGAIAVILVDVFDPPLPFDEAVAELPSLVIGRSAGDALAAALAQGPVTVGLRRAVGIERDSAVDNTVIAHEWGHYLHNRLAECFAEACLGMSEGWGDFNALMMMLREGDDRDGTYAVSSYASTVAKPNAAYFGLRRFPYSLDRTKNALSYRHISDGEPLPTETPGMPSAFPNSEVHNTGEVWATMLWEVLNVLADQHGVTIARRRMSDYVVAGLLLTPPEATFTEARDAILVAASALDTDDMVLMAAAFAGRGAGSCAVSPPDNLGNIGVVESGTLAANLQVGGLTVTEDGVSCDRDGYLDPGESGTLRVTVANASVIAADNVTVTAASSTPGLRFGAPVRLATLAGFASAEIAIPVTVLASAPRAAVATIELAATADNTCTRAAALATVTVRIGVDDRLATSRIDRFETRVTPWTVTGEHATSVWQLATDGAQNQAWSAGRVGSPADTQLVSPPLQVSATAPFVLSISHAYDLEAADDVLFEGAVIEVSRDDGATWTDVSELGVDPGYTGAFAPWTGPLAGHPAFGGTSPGFPDRQRLRLDFGAQFAGQTVRVRFRVVTLGFIGGGASWTIDDVAVEGTVNTPFPELVAEPSTCTARAASLGGSAVLAAHQATAASLDAFDAAVCIATEDSM